MSGGKVWIGAGLCWTRLDRALLPSLEASSSTLTRRSLAGNLPSRIAERDVEYEFRPFGRIMSVWVARKPPGFGVRSELPREACTANRRHVARSAAL
jgi:hypothetical protein